MLVYTAKNINKYASYGKDPKSTQDVSNSEIVTEPAIHA